MEENPLFTPIKPLTYLAYLAKLCTTELPNLRVWE